jgi:hypothetical protein
MLTTIQLTSGKAVFVHGIELSGTYSGLLEGIPTEKMNKSIIDSSIRRAQDLWLKTGNPTPAYLIEPVCASIIHKESDHHFLESVKRILLRGDRPGPILPPVRCIANLTAFPTAEQSLWTKLAVVWFQNLFFESTLQSVLQNALENIPWEANAKSFEP